VSVGGRKRKMEKREGEGETGKGGRSKKVGGGWGLINAFKNQTMSNTSFAILILKGHTIVCSLTGI